ncbi:MAG: guanylate kinase [Acidobacteriota bacterium]|nr:guanylate kinase [Acidobacteriota bacterium]MDH3530259.1 guanylate kinase [Acidobacteriota bacterium]
MNGRLLIISSPSGGGKGTIIGEVRADVVNLAYSVSHTTREIREGETDGIDYHFVSKPDFEKLIRDDEFLEYAEVHGNYYGTSKTFVDRETGKGRDVLLEIDVQGAEQVRGKVPDSVSVFILPPSFGVLKERLSQRKTESPEELALRLENAAAEVRHFSDFDYVIVNDKIEDAAADLKMIIKANRLLRIRQKGLIRDILTTFDNH